MAEEIGLFEALYNTRAIRYFKPDPVPQELIRRVLDAAIRAPSGGNQQTWRFLVIRDPGLRRRIAELYLEVWEERHPIEQRRQMAKEEPERWLRVYRAANHLAHHMAEVPVLILACLQRSGPAALSSAVGSSIYPAVQNMLLAARGLGLGAVLTLDHKQREAQIKALLGIPDNAETFALVPLGYPAVPFAPVRRRPIEEVSYADRWGNRLD